MSDTTSTTTATGTPAPPTGPDTSWMDGLGLDGNETREAVGVEDESSQIEDETNTDDVETDEVDDSEDADEATEEGDDLKADVDKWKSLARKHERRAKLNADKAAELDAIKANPAFAGLDDQGKALEALKVAAKAEARQFFAERLVAAEVRAAAAGTDLDVGLLVSNLNHDALLTEDGDVDSAKVKALVSALKPRKVNQKVDLGQGHRGKTTPTDRPSQWGEFFEKNF